MTDPQAPPSSSARSWPPGLPRSLDYPAVPVGSVLRAAARRWGDRVAFVDSDVELTFTELARLVVPPSRASQPTSTLPPVSSILISLASMLSTSTTITGPDVAACWRESMPPLMYPGSVGPRSPLAGRGHVFLKT